LLPSGRLTNYIRYTKVDLETRGVVERIMNSSPQSVRRAPGAQNTRKSKTKKLVEKKVARRGASSARRDRLVAELILDFSGIAPPKFGFLERASRVKLRIGRTKDVDSM